MAALEHLAVMLVKIFFELDVDLHVELLWVFAHNVQSFVLSALKVRSVKISDHVDSVKPRLFLQQLV